MSCCLSSLIPYLLLTVRRTLITFPLIALWLGLFAAVQPPPPPAEKIVAGASEQAREGALYMPGYFTIPYPNGDLPRNQGVCTDVVVRALRKAGYDLQKLVYEDMKRNFNKYPQLWGLRKPDPNIDHRRVPNLMCFFER